MAIVPGFGEPSDSLLFFDIGICRFFLFFTYFVTCIYGYHPRRIFSPGHNPETNMKLACVVHQHQTVLSPGAGAKAQPLSGARYLARRVQELLNCHWRRIGLSYSGTEFFFSGGIGLTDEQLLKTPRRHWHIFQK
jgi:hypothetical protein